MGENFKPIAVTNPAAHPKLFKVRCLVDLQLATISKYLRPALLNVRGTVLDVGAGEAPWRGWLQAGAIYQGIDINNAVDFGMTEGLEGVHYYDGKLIPYGDESFDNILCIEVLEHAVDPNLLIKEMARVLKNNGKLILSIPWSARRHHIPFDYQRFTREKLLLLLTDHGFSQIEIYERGSDISVIANKLIVLTLRLLRPRASISTLWAIFIGLCCLPVTAIFLISGHISEFFGLGAYEDPLGYFVTAVRSRF